MAVSRREFLQRSGLLVVGAVLPVSALAGTVPLTPGNGTNGAIGTGLSSGGGDAAWTQAAFQQCLGTEFALQQTPDQKVWLLLTAVADMSGVQVVKPVTMAVPAPKPQSPAPDLDCFILSFRASLAQPLTQNTYQLDHATLGQFPLFIVPAGQDPQLYYAVVNRLQAAPYKIHPGKIGPPDGIADQPPVGGNPSSGNGNRSGGGAAVPKPGPNSGPGPEPRPGIQPNLSRE
jgi:hypothetical protein